jgi:hypothetical protein
MAPLESPPVYTGKRVIGCPTLPFTTVEDDPDVTPVLKVLAQLFVSVQPSTSDYKDEQVPADQVRGHVLSRVGSPIIFIRVCGSPP